MERIRIMRADDYEVLTALWTSVPGIGLNSLDDTEAGIRKFLKRNPHTCFIAEVDGIPAGTIMAGNDGRRGYIYHTAVKPEYQGRGIGRRLVERVMTALDEEGIAKVALVVFSRNAGGNAFWEKMGFTTRSDITYRNRNIHEFVRYDT